MTKRDGMALAELVDEAQQQARRFGQCGRIAAIVAEQFGVRATELLSDRRARVVARPRMVAMYLAKQTTDLTLPVIGAAFNRDHTTVLHAVNEVTNLMHFDAVFKERVEKLRVLVGNDLAHGAEQIVQEAISREARELQRLADVAFRRDALGASAAVVAALRSFVGAMD